MPDIEAGGVLRVADPLADAARELAAGHRTLLEARRRPPWFAPRRAPPAAGRRHLLARLPGQEAILRQGRVSFTAAAEREEAPPPPVVAWLLDNYYVLQQTFRLIRTDMPPGFYRALPRLGSGALAGIPRAYALAAEVFRRIGGVIDMEEIRRFLRLYQEAAPLDMGELWALPVMLRFVCLEQLAQAVGRSLGRSREQVDPFPGVALPERLADEEIAANCVTGLRTLASEDWPKFFESASLVESMLRKDPAGVYGRMDFRTRDRYRAAVERLARRARRPEEEAARQAVELARSGGPPDERNGGRSSHVGTYLIGAGRRELEERLGWHPSAPLRLARRLAAAPAALYLGPIGLLTLLACLGWARYAAAAGGTAAQAAAAALLALLPAVTAAVDLVNHLVTRLVPPRILPKLDFDDGIPPRCRSIVAVPALLARPQDAHALLQQLELHYLRNPDPNLYFGLLTDFADAPRRSMPEDEELVGLVREGIQALNRRHSGRYPNPFFLFHRLRTWNGGEECWMGWERKRGKLHELNRLLLGREPCSPYLLEGDRSLLSTIRYVITLDADTILLPGSASRLAGTLAHPLNRPEFDSATGRVVSGYTILQPRTEVQPEAAARSAFTRIYAGEPGLDLYTLAVSDAYQDLFGEGSFVGKGIYDAAAFERSLDGKVPENTLLSHDLFEGIQGRAALVSDVVLLEDFPPSYLALAARTHRWARGDWQLLPWLLSRAGPGRAPARGGLSPIARWKIADNLRRSLVTPALLALLAAGWLILPGPALAWTLFAAFSLAVPAAARLLGVPARLARGAPLPAALRPAGIAALRALLPLVFLPYEALLHLHAVAITLWRILVTRRRLLRWTPSAAVHSLFGEGQSEAASWRQMAPAVAIGAALALLLALLRPAALPAAAPLLLAWLLSPEAAYRASRPLRRRPAALSAGQRQSLRALARRSWLYFERFVDPVNRWLPPDHFQEHPRGTVAHRTSPTNIGLMLASTLGAYDLGYLGPLSLSLRLKNAFQTMDRLDRGRGHLFNWYDTRTMAPLPPRYISTVDSGNLGACLLALRQGCRELPAEPFPGPQQRRGLLDTLALLRQTLQRVGYRRELAPYLQPLLGHLDGMVKRLESARPGVGSWAALLADLENLDWKTLQRLLVPLVREQTHLLEPSFIHQLRVHAELVPRALSSLRREIDTLLPWIRFFQEPPAGLDRPDPGLREAWEELRQALPDALALERIADACAAGRTRAAALRAALAGPRGEAGPPPPGFAREALDWCRRLEEKLEDARRAAQGLLDDLDEIARKANAYVEAMDFRFLFDAQRQVFHIGYNVESERLDPNHYDLLASEARVASLLAIAKGDVPESHWLHLSRPFTRADGSRVLLSWSAGMFEYLMPMILARHRPGTLLFESGLAAVDQQIRYGQRRGIPWGISESAFYLFDAQMGYQYQAFGVPGLGFKRGLEDDLVIAPYAAVLALPLRPVEAMENLAAMSNLCMEGVYGLYESIDYTLPRLPLGREMAVVRSYYAHHTGMIFLTLVNYLAGRGMIRRFHADPRIRSVEMLLEERAPDHPPVQQPHLQDTRGAWPGEATAGTISAASAWPVPVQPPVPQACLLSNGRYGVFLTSAGGGASSWQEIDLTRWRADTTLDDWGTWIYLEDREEGTLWSAGYQPTGISSPTQEALFSPYHAELRRRDHDISLVLEVTVPPDQDAEVRRITLTNHSGRPRRLRITSYGEPILALQSADERHPAFNKLFIESRFLAEENALLFHRRPRSARDTPAYLVHQVILAGKPAFAGGPAFADGPAAAAFETDRLAFLGRGGTVRAPRALTGTAQAGAAGNAPGGFTGSVGATLDPVMVLSQEVEIRPFGTARLAFVTGAAGSEAEARAIARHFLSFARIERSFQQARLQSEREMHRRGATAEELSSFQQLFTALLYPSGQLRADPAVLSANTLGQPGLWRFTVSGDHPILLARIRDLEELPLVQELLRAHAWFRRRNVKIDLVLLALRGDGYIQELAEALRRLVSRGHNAQWINRRGGIFLLSAGQMSEAERTLLETAARVVLDGSRGPLSRQLRALDAYPLRLPAFIPTLPPSAGAPQPPAPTDGEVLLFDNGLGGFSPDGREYVVRPGPGRWTPAPWANVVANARFGFLVTESGGGYTWCLNSGENRLTPWSNDPVSDRPGEAIYLRDEETGEVWSPTPLPAGPPASWRVRHGAGYSVFRHHSHGLDQELEVTIDRDAPVKILHLGLANRLPRPRRITVTFYAEWVLGVMRERMQPYIQPEYDRENQALLAANPYNVDFAGRVAFVSASEGIHGLTTDRAEFLGRMGSLARPAALGRIGLSDTVRAGLDPCAAVQVHVNLEPGEDRQVCFLLGQGASRGEALELIRRFRQPQAVERARREGREHWERLLTAVQVRTPEPAMDLLLNRWLLYQDLSCRLWGRSGFYQSGGAFGFRDQLQDVMALVHALPSAAREHILEAARHQFEAGDVLHWWHPPKGRGARTRVSDDLLWLPFVTAFYVEATGDRSILAEKVPFLRAPPLEPEEEERYGLYEPTAESYPLYEHCRRALQRGGTRGRHGLPLMGAGDWNDGMNRVGIEGKGESVWLGWFLYACLTRFAPFCASMDDAPQGERYLRQAEALRAALEASAWDGDWYRRAWYDDGTPLGSARSQECRIDAIAQSWAALCGAGEPARVRRAMESVRERLVRPGDRLVLLFTPPFDGGRHDPGYIKGYPPGIRENGGQYTHAALWTAWAFAELGQVERAEGLFRLLNPIHHSDTLPKARRYRLEPYVVAADVYSAAPHTGRGGWSWYTGSGGWMYRLGLEAILGVRRSGDALRIEPRLPPGWRGCEVSYRFGAALYRIEMSIAGAGGGRRARRITLDGRPLRSRRIPLRDDGEEHRVQVLLG